MDKKEQILKLVAEYIQEKHASKKWEPGKEWVQYSGPVFDDKEYVAAVKTLLNEWLVLGTDAITFENKFPPLLGKEFGVVTNSGSSANLLMMLAMTSKKYSKQFKELNPKFTKIIVPVAGFPTTINPVIQLGFKPEFVDIDIHNLNINLDEVERAALMSNTRIITFAHVLGNPPNMDKLMGIVKKYNLILLEDCCDALGSTYDGKPLGSFGDMSSCSFYPAHHITMGEGGFVACKTKEQEKIVRSFREWGRGCYCVGKKANLLKQGTCGCRFSKWLEHTFPNEIFDHKYIYDEIGYNLKPIELQCSMGLVQLEKLPEIHRIRKENYKKLFEIFRPYEKFFFMPKATLKSDPSWFAFPLTIKNGVPFKRSDICEFLENNKIQTRNYFGGNLLLQPGYMNVEWDHPLLGKTNSYSYVTSQGWYQSIKNRFPVATKVTTDTFFLGTSPVITTEQITYIGEKIEEFFKHY